MTFAPRSAVVLNARPAWAEWPPHPALAEHVVSYWSARFGDGPQRITSLPDGCADLTIDLTEPGRPIAYLTGPQKGAVVHRPRGPMHLFGARLFPQSAVLLVGRPLRGDRWTRLDTFLGPRAHAVARAVALASDDASRVGCFDGFLIEQLLARSVDGRLTLALDAIFRSGGTLTVGELARRSAASPRTLTRLFKIWVGLTPKRFVRIVRFQHALRQVSGQLIGRG